MRLFGRSPERRRTSALGKVRPGPLADYLAVPWPSPDTPIEEISLLALDIETTGLNADRDAILSVGMVPVDGGVIRLAGAQRLLVRTTTGVGQSATIHGLTDDAVAGGVELAEAVGVVLGALAGRVLLAHHARIETDFLSAACERFWGLGMPCAVVDTMRLAERLLSRRLDEDVPAGALRLWAARDRCGLPATRAHDALTDALACAELYLAQTAELSAATKEPLTLRGVAG